MKHINSTRSFLKMTFVILLSVSLQGYAQQLTQQQFNYKSQIMERIKFPKSPEAEAFEKYGNTPVNMYNGTPNISVPLHTLNGREFNVPLSLSYDATGVKVEQVATNVGLNWNLNAGGRISRIANGRPDDVFPDDGPLSQFPNEQLIANVNNTNYYSGEDVTNHFVALETLSKGCYDLLYDLYSLNVMDINDYIVIEDNQAHTLLNPRIKVEYSSNPAAPSGGTEWKVIAEDGTIYFFGQNNIYETSETSGIPDDGNTECARPRYFSTGSWLLTQVKSKNNLDNFTFDYDNHEWQNLRTGPTIGSFSHTTENLLTASPGWNIGGQNYAGGIMYTTSQYMLTGISNNGKLLVDFTYKFRSDIEYKLNKPGALDKIKFYKYRYRNLLDIDNTINPIFKTITFNHSYFGLPNGNYFQKRLRLDSVVIAESDNNINGNNSKTYSFDYFDDYVVPPTTSFSQDYLGLYNGKLNDNLVSGIVGANGTSGITGANRSFVLELALTGTLQKITYPTGGFTIFDFEPHSANSHGITTYSAESPLGMQCGINNNEKHPWMQGFGGVETVMFYIPESDTYKIEFYNPHHNGLFLLHRPVCSNDVAPSSDFQRSSKIPNTPAMRPSCLHLEAMPTRDIFVTGGDITNTSNAPQGSFMTGITLNPNPKDYYFAAGYYQATVWNTTPIDPNNPGGPFPAPPVANSVEDNPYLHIYRQVPHYPENIKVQGFRIKSIKDYTKGGTLPATEKEYRYTIEIDSQVSSGEEIDRVPSAEGYYKSQVLEGPNDLEVMAEHITRTTAGIENSPHIGYRKVYEINKIDTADMGYIEHYFNYDSSPTGLVSTGGIKSFKTQYGGDEYFTVMYDKNHRKISAERSDYEIVPVWEYYGGITTTIDYKNKGKMMSWYQCPDSDVFSTDWHWLYRQCMTLGGSDMCVLMTPPYLTNPNYMPPCQGFGGFNKNENIGGFALATIAVKYESSLKHLKRKSTTNYFYQNSITKLVSKTEENVYDSGYPYLLEKNISDIGNSQTISKLEKQFAYYSDDPAKITDVKTYRYTDNNIPVLLSHTNNVYTDFYHNTGMANYVSDISTAKGNQSLELRAKFDYNGVNGGDGNIVQSTQVSDADEDIYESYIFGYDDQFPIVKISGMKYSDLDPHLILDLKEKSNQPILPYDPTQNLVDSNTQILIDNLNAFRDIHSKALITTYTYDPVKGVTTETDPRGNIMYYVYDELGRLKTVKDAQGNIISENEYHYRPHN